MFALVRNICKILRQVINPTEDMFNNSFPVVLSEDVKHGGMVLHGQRFVRKMSEIGGWPLEGSHVIGGRFIDGSNMIEFDLTNVLNNDAE